MSKLMHALLILTFVGGAAMLAASLRAAPAMPAPANQPKIAGAKFAGDGRLQRPVNYRNWRFVTAGLGMSYGPAAQAAAMTGHVMFDNVFVQPAAYDAFVRDGVWPEGTMFVLELRGSLTKRTPNNGGHFQDDLHGVEVSVKDSSRFKGRWAYFEFGMSSHLLRLSSAACRGRYDVRAVLPDAAEDWDQILSYFCLRYSMPARVSSGPRWACTDRSLLIL
jgi:hypothetical protein